MMSPAELRAAREATIRVHMESENAHDFEATLATFAHPRYELVPTGEVHDGVEAVRRYYEETRAAFPDQRNRLRALYHADDAVIVELDLEGTHLGPLRGMPATGRAFVCQMIAVFELAPGSALITCERVYFDLGTMLRQLGLAHDPRTRWGRLTTLLNHPVTVGGAALRRLRDRR